MKISSVLHEFHHDCRSCNRQRSPLLLWPCHGAEYAAVFTPGLCIKASLAIVLLACRFTLDESPAETVVPLHVRRACAERGFTLSCCRKFAFRTASFCSQCPLTKMSLQYAFLPFGHGGLEDQRPDPSRFVKVGATTRGRLMDAEGNFGRLHTTLRFSFSYESNLKYIISQQSENVVILKHCVGNYTNIWVEKPKPRIYNMEVEGAGDAQVRVKIYTMAGTEVISWLTTRKIRTRAIHDKLLQHVHDLTTAEKELVKLLVKDTVVVPSGSTSLHAVLTKAGVKECPYVAQG